VLSLTPLAKVPQGFTVDQVVTLPTNPMTSFLVLFTSEQGFNYAPPWEPRAGSEKDDAIVIIGGGTVVGKFGVQFARLAGIGRIIVVAGEDNAGELKDMGATHVISRHLSGEIIRQVHAITGPQGVKKVCDCRSMTFELATSLPAPSEPSTLLTVHPVDQPDVITKERPKCKAQFVEASSPGLAPAALAVCADVAEG